MAAIAKPNCDLNRSVSERMRVCLRAIASPSKRNDAVSSEPAQLHAGPASGVRPSPNRDLMQRSVRPSTQGRLGPLTAHALPEAPQPAWDSLFCSIQSNAASTSASSAVLKSDTLAPGALALMRSSSAWAWMCTQFSPRRTFEVNFCCFSSVIVVLACWYPLKLWFTWEQPRASQTKSTTPPFPSRCQLYVAPGSALLPCQSMPLSDQWAATRPLQRSPSAAAVPPYLKSSRRLWLPRWAHSEWPWT